MSLFSKSLEFYASSVELSEDGKNETREIRGTKRRRRHEKPPFHEVNRCHEAKHHRHQEGMSEAYRRAKTS